MEAKPDSHDPGTLIGDCKVPSTARFGWVGDDPATPQTVSKQYTSGKPQHFGEGRNEMPLRALVQDGNLVISIGIRTLAFAFETSEGNNPYDPSSGDFKRELQIADPLQFAEDVCHEINGEGEDGSTPLTRFLDSMMDEAVNNGSLGILYPDDDTSNPCEELDTA